MTKWNHLPKTPISIDQRFLDVNCAVTGPVLDQISANVLSYLPTRIHYKTCI